MFSHNITKTLLSATALCLISACGIIDKRDTAEESNWFVRMIEKDGQSYANKATVAFTTGDFNKALEYTTEALKDNPRNQQALLVGALTAERMGRYNKARQFYEDLIVIGGENTSILGSSTGQPERIPEIAKNNLRRITIAQSNLIIENRDGTKHFSIAEDAGELQSKTTIANALSKKNIKVVRTQPIGVDDLFTPAEQNIVSRFLILKELAEKDFITKDEFLSRRIANIGGLLPLTHRAPGVGVDQPVPSPDLIIERLNILREGVETRAITPREFSAERDIIIEALMDPNPRKRLKNKAPSKNILDAATDLRRLEVLYDLNLITEGEKNAEKRAIEKHLGVNKPISAPKTQTTSQPSAPIPSPAPVVEKIAEPTPTQAITKEVIASPEAVATITISDTATSQPQTISAPPLVSSPF